MYSFQNNSKAYFKKQNEDIQMCDESPEDNNDKLIYEILTDFNGSSANTHPQFNFKSPAKKEKPQ